MTFLQLSLRNKLKIYSCDSIANIRNILGQSEVKKVIWIASYPRSGSTWFRRIIGGLCNIKGLRACPGIHKFQEKTFDLVIPVQANGEEVCFIKTHGLPFTNYQFPLNIGSKVINHGFIYLYRHPLDVLVSSLNFLYHKKEEQYFFENQIKSVEELSYSGEIDLYLLEYIKNFSIGNHAYENMCGGTWLNHVNTWTSLHKSNKYLSTIIKYEDLVENPFVALKTVLNWLGKDDTNLQKALELADKRTQKNESFYWKRKSGNYQEHFKEKEIKIFLKKYKSNLDYLGY